MNDVRLLQLNDMYNGTVKGFRKLPDDTTCEYEIYLRKDFDISGYHKGFFTDINVECKRFINNTLIPNIIDLFPNCMVRVFIESSEDCSFEDCTLVGEMKCVSQFIDELNERRAY